MEYNEEELQLTTLPYETNAIERIKGRPLITTKSRQAG
jgi:hypothetical protein